MFGPLPTWVRLPPPEAFFPQFCLSSSLFFLLRDFVPPFPSCSLTFALPALLFLFSFLVQQVRVLCPRLMLLPGFFEFLTSLSFSLHLFRFPDVFFLLPCYLWTFGPLPASQLVSTTIFYNPPSSVWFCRFSPLPPCQQVLALLHLPLRVRRFPDPAFLPVGFLSVPKIRQLFCFGPFPMLTLVCR